MTNDGIDVRLTAAVLEPGILVPSRRESGELNDAITKNAAQFPVRLYRMMLEALELPEQQKGPSLACGTSASSGSPVTN